LEIRNRPDNISITFLLFYNIGRYKSLADITRTSYLS